MGGLRTMLILAIITVIAAWLQGGSDVACLATASHSSAGRNRVETNMQRLIDNPEATLRRAADHVLIGYAWFFSDRNVTVPAAALLLRLADEVFAERCRWMALLARN